VTEINIERIYPEFKENIKHTHKTLMKAFAAKDWDGVQDAHASIVQQGAALLDFAPAKTDPTVEEQMIVAFCLKKVAQVILGPGNENRIPTDELQIVLDSSDLCLSFPLFTGTDDETREQAKIWRSMQTKAERILRSRGDANFKPNMHARGFSDLASVFLGPNH